MSSYVIFFNYFAAIYKLNLLFKFLKDKENEGPNAKKHCENVTVTLTLNSPVDDVMIVLRNLANVLRIPVPVHYSITERNVSSNHKLGVFKIKGKDGKEGG